MGRQRIPSLEGARSDVGPADRGGHIDGAVAVGHELDVGGGGFIDDASILRKFRVEPRLHKK